MKEHVVGLVAAPHTPMRDDRSINLDAVEEQATLIAANGVVGAFVCGSTGEGQSLTLPERMQLAERWTNTAPDTVRVIVHAGDSCLDDCRTLAAHAQEIGAFAVAAAPPCFFKPATLDDLIDFCAGVASAAPELPFYYYHIPALTGVDFPMSEFLEAGAGRIPTLAGMKFTDENLMQLRKCLDLQDGRFNIMFGRDEILLAGLALGARAAVGSTYNYMSPLYRRVIDAFETGDIKRARADQSRAIAVVDLLHRYGGVPTGKAIMAMVGVDCGPVRPPFRNLSADQLAELRAGLERVGFFEFCSRMP